MKFLQVHTKIFKCLQIAFQPEAWEKKSHEHLKYCVCNGEMSRIIKTINAQIQSPPQAKIFSRLDYFGQGLVLTGSHSVICPRNPFTSVTQPRWPCQHSDSMHPMQGCKKQTWAELDSKGRAGKSRMLRERWLRSKRRLLCKTSKEKLGQD